MSRYIDADALEKYFFRPYSNEEAYSNLDVLKVIDNTPTIDIVRCKECEHYEPYSASCNISNGLRNANADGFCSYGEREGE